MPSSEIKTRKYPRPTVEGLALATAISQIHIIPLFQTGLTLAIHSWLDRIPPETMAEIALSIFAGTTLVSYFYELDTLKKLGLTSNPFTVFFYTKIDNPLAATAIGNILGQIVHSFNPVDIAYTTASQISQDDGRLLYSNLISRFILTSIFTTGFNWALRRGRADRIVAQIHNLRLKLERPVLDRLGQLNASLERSLAASALVLAYQAGNVSHEEMLTSVDYFCLTPFSSHEKTMISSLITVSR